MRQTPQNIDRSVKVMEYAMAFLIPSIITFPLLELWAIPVGATVCGLTIKVSAGKPPGFLEETLYRWGVQLRELLPPKIKHLDH